MSAGHTPGPWAIVPYGDGESLVIHYGQTQQRICFMATPSSLTDDFPRIKANARLIAAAPDLLEALTELVRWHAFCHPDTEFAFEDARKAITRATGHREEEK